MKDGIHSYCKECGKVKYPRNKVKTEDKRDQHYKNRYGISLTDYNELKISQKFSCAICGKHEQLTIRQRLVVDHCHSTGKVRGLLCDNCNHGLGKFKDNKEYLLNAIEYLGVEGTTISQQDVVEADYEEIDDDDITG